MGENSQNRAGFKHVIPTLAHKIRVCEFEFCSGQLFSSTFTFQIYIDFYNHMSRELMELVICVDYTRIMAQVK